MKKIIFTIMIVSSIITMKLSGQTCEANFEVEVPQCKYVFTNTSDPSWLFKWTVNGQTYNQMNIEFQMDAYESFNICLYTHDTLNNCRDTICKTVKGVKKLTFDYHVYKQKLFATAHQPGVKTSMFVMEYGDKTVDNSTIVGVFKHTYLQPGKYRVKMARIDEVIFNNRKRACVIYSGNDSVIIDGSSACKARFVSFRDTGVDDSLWIVNNSAGENLKYFWDFGDGSSSTKTFPEHIYSVKKRVNICLTIQDTLKNCINTFCDSVSVTPGLYMQTISKFDPVAEDTNTVAVNEAFKERVSIHPNPFTNSINIVLPEGHSPVQWQILAGDGKQLMQGQFDSMRGFHKIDADLLKTGIYILVLNHKDGTMVQKLIKN
jgi:hypothetical protein